MQSDTNHFISFLQRHHKIITKSRKQSQYSDNYMTYPTVGSTSKSQKDDINRIRSMSVQQRSSGTSQNITNHLHCFNNKTSSSSTTTTSNHISHSITASNNQRNRIYLRNHVSRSRSKTVSGTDDIKLTNRIPSTINDDDVLNGNVGICNGQYDTREKLRRSSVRNYTRTTILNDIACGIPTANGIDRDNNNKLKTTSIGERDVMATGTCNVPSVKRNKRTLSSTHIEREKSDEKNIKLLRKNAIALRTLSPLMAASNQTSSTLIGATKTNKQIACDEHMIGPTNKRSQSICTSLAATVPQKSNATNNSNNNNNISTSNNTNYVALRLRKR